MGQLWLCFINIIKKFIKDKKLSRFGSETRFSVPLKSTVKMHNDSCVELGKLESFILILLVDKVRVLTPIT